MITLPENYQKNINILKLNLKRGMDNSTVNTIINDMEVQLINANKYHEDEKNFIKEMQRVALEHFTSISITTN